MTDYDRELQRAFDRHLRGEGPPPDTDDDPEAAAYEVVYASLSEEPEGELPDGFAHRVADRVGLSAKPAMGWIEIVLLLLIVAGAGAGLVLMPPSAAGLQQSVGDLLMTFRDVSNSFRLDVVVAILLVLIMTIGFDTLLQSVRPERHPVSL